MPDRSAASILPAPFRPSTTTLVDGQVYAGEDFEGAVGRRPSAVRVAPGGQGQEAHQARDLFLDDLPSRLGEEFFGAAQLTPTGGDGTGTSFALGLEVFSFFERWRVPCSGGARLILSGIPPQVIDIDVSAVGIQVKRPG